MSKRISGFFLGLFLCLALSATAFAAETASVAVTVHDLAPGYYLGAVWDGDTLLVLFDAQVDSSGILNQVVEIGDTTLSGDTVTIAISNANIPSAGSKPIVLSNVLVSSGGETGKPEDPAPPDEPDKPENPAPDGKPHGTVRASAEYAAEGAEITLTATPEAGYKLSLIQVTDSQGEEVYRAASGNTHTFPMPASDVTVMATFEQVK